jgi:3-dehydroquinate synthase
MDRLEHTVKVSLADRSYDIVIGRGLLADVGRRLKALGHGGQAAIVTDTHVGRLYARAVARSLHAAGFQPRTITAPAGEAAKTMAWAGRVVDQLARAGFERQSVAVALGGGVVGDLTGFAASVYVRGIPFVQIPTTLVAQVDSSVGGKTGVNHPVGKNLIGTFYQPRLVLIDPETLTTLPAREWRAGLAEVIKYGVIADAAFFVYLEQNMDEILAHADEPVRRIVVRSCEIKAEVVGQDEREADRRRILNYGHTIGHALEALGNYRTLIHGEAIAIGMVQEAAYARFLGLCDEQTVERQRALVRRAGLPTDMPAVRFADLWKAMQHDKKVAQGRVYCVLPEAIGRVRVQAIDEGSLRAWFDTVTRPRRRVRRPATTRRSR